jgi:hypothetical protein
MIDRHKAAAEKMARAAALRRVISTLGPTADKISRRRLQSGGNDHVSIMRTAHRVTRAEALGLAVSAEHAALADLAEHLEDVIDGLVASAAADLAIVAKDRRWKVTSLQQEE